MNDLRLPNELYAKMVEASKQAGIPSKILIVNALVHMFGSSSVEQIKDWIETNPFILRNLKRH